MRSPPFRRVGWLRGLPSSSRRRHPAGADPTVVPVDPRLALTGPLDPALDEIRSGLAGHRRRLWLRRILRRTWLAAAGIAVAEAALLGLARLVPI